MLREVDHEDGFLYEMQLVAWWWEYIGIPVLKLNPKDFVK